VLLFKDSYGFIALPGGVGTIDELFEAFTLIQSGKIRQFPMILMGTEYWRPLTDLLHRMAIDGAIGPRDLDLLLVTDDVEDAINHLKRNAIDRFALRAPRPSRWLGESGPEAATSSVRP
jgi:predicted Rossmann-fold nucleotide-binding protein